MTESIHALSGAYVVDALDDSERATFEEHLPGCLDCQAEVASLREAAVLMADDAALAPPAALREQVLAGIRTVRPLPPPTGTLADEEPGRSAVVVPLRRHRFRMATMAAAAAVVAVLGVGAVTQPWQDDSPPISAVSPADRVLAADDAAHITLSFPNGSKASLVRSEKLGRAVLVTTRMDAPPSGKIFELWLRNAEGRMVPAGKMKAGGDQKILLTGDAGKATAAGITVEPAGGSSSPTTPPIAMFDFDKAGA